MTTLLRPAYTVTIGNQMWSEQALEIDMRLASAPLTERLRVRLPARAPVEAAVGERIKLELDGGEGMRQVFAGEVTAIRRSLTDISVLATGALGKLAQYRPAITFENSTAGTVIESLASDAQIDIGAIEEGVNLTYYAANPTHSAFEHAAKVAGWSGALLTSDADGRLAAYVVNASSADLALLYGREITQISLEERGDPPAVTIAGESGASNDAAPEASRPSADVFAGNRPSGPGLGDSWFFEPALRTASAAATAGAAHQRQLAASQQTGQMTTFLIPQLRPGTVIDLQGLPAGMGEGPFWLSDVQHRLTPLSASTTCELRKGGDSFDPSALLGSLAGTVGAF